MNKLKILVASMLCSFFVIGLAGCGDEPVEGSACTQATAENDCASSTATKYVCHKQGTAETCLRDCTDSGKKACTAQEKCVDSSNGRKACVPTTPAGGDDKCGDKTCKADEVCNKTDAANPKCEKKVVENSYWSIMIVDKTTATDQCKENTDAGSDIIGVAVTGADGTPASFFKGSSSKDGNPAPGGGYSNTGLNGDALPIQECPYNKLSDKQTKVQVLGCGGKATFVSASADAKAFKTGDSITVWEYSGQVCTQKSTSPDPAKEDVYDIYACKSKNASVEPEANIDGDNCVLQAENVSGYHTVQVK